MEENKKIKSFTDLIVWRRSHRLVLMVFKLTKTFSKSELYFLIDQMRRAVLSITSNIAEGFSRHFYKEKLQYYYQSLGSLTELQNQLLVARDLGYLKNGEFDKIAKETVEIQKMLNAFILKTKSFV